MKLKFRYRFESAHRFVNAASPRCQTPHGHTWYVTLVVSPLKAQLNSESMVAEFQNIKKNWREFIDETVDHSFFYNVQDPLYPYLKEFIPNFRGLPFFTDPTTEMIACLFLVKAQALIEASPVKNQVMATGIFIEETPTNSIEVSVEDQIFKNARTMASENYEGWWQTDDIYSRHLQAKTKP